MVPTRRQVLAGCTALLGSLAGCNEGTRDRADGPKPPENVEVDPPAVSLRGTGERPVAWYLPAGETARYDGTPPDIGDNSRAAGHLPSRLISAPEAASRIEFADVDGRERARTFVERTNFDRETLHDRAIDALQGALAARATPLLNREQLVVLVDEIRSTADRFRDRDRGEPVERESLVHGLGEYVSVAALAGATPPSSATVAAAVRTDAR